MAGPSLNDKKTVRLIAPVSPKELEQYEAACKEAGLLPPETLRRLAAALVAQVKEHGYLVTPIKLAGPPKGKK